MIHNVSQRLIIHRPSIKYKIHNTGTIIWTKYQQNTFVSCPLISSPTMSMFHSWGNLPPQVFFIFTSFFSKNQLLWLFLTSRQNSSRSIEQVSSSTWNTILEREEWFIQDLSITTSYDTLYFIILHKGISLLVLL